MDDLIGGSIGGVAQTFIGYPFDTAKVHYVKYNCRGFIDFWHGINQAGWRSLYRGVISPMGGAVATNAQTFYLYSTMQNKFNNSWISGCIVGASLATIETPIDLIKSRMQTSKIGSYSDCVKSIIKSGGIKNLMRGLTITTWRNTLSVGSMFGGYEVTKSLFPMHPILGSFIGGIVGGALCWGPWYPLDNLKTHIQTDKRLVQPTIIARARKIGWKMLWRGFTPCIIRAMVVNPFIFVAYEVGSDTIRNLT